jgi:hypothetical protein
VPLHTIPGPTGPRLFTIHLSSQELSFIPQELKQSIIKECIL